MTVPGGLKTLQMPVMLINGDSVMFRPEHMIEGGPRMMVVTGPSNGHAG